MHQRRQVRMTGRADPPPVEVKAGLVQCSDGHRGPLRNGGGDRGMAVDHGVFTEQDDFARRAGHDLVHAVGWGTPLQAVSLRRGH